MSVFTMAPMTLNHLIKHRALSYDRRCGASRDKLRTPDFD
jgi:hypothetical protein